MTTLNEHMLRCQVDKAMATVRNILDLTRTPRYAEDEEHVYDDKFGLAEFLTNSAIAAQVNALERLGLDGEKLKRLTNFVKEDKRSVTLRFALQESCTFVKEKTVDIESPRRFEVEVTERKRTNDDGEETASTAVKQKVITKVKEFHWKVDVQYGIFAFPGNDPNLDPVELCSRASSAVIVTTGGKRPPVQDRSVTQDLSLTWLLQQLVRDDLVCDFRIDRSKEETLTPRRNEDIHQAFEFFKESAIWCSTGQSLLVDTIENVLRKHQPAATDCDSSLTNTFDKVNAEHVFVPVLPLMEAQSKDADEKEDKPAVLKTAIVSLPQTQTPLLSLGDINRFLTEQCRSLDEVSVELQKTFAKHDKEGKLLTSNEATIVMLYIHMVDISTHFRNGVDYVEHMLHQQMVAAIGKEVKPKDFEEFVRFHNKKIFNPKYLPKAFCYAIRRPDHYPDGVLTIEGNDEPVETIVRKISGADAPPMFFPINAATSVEFTGERYLHAWIRHRFGYSESPSYKLIARARQFSSFLLMVGTIAGHDKFEPKDAIILQNKDEVLIPILLDELPTAKEFKDAISSLSPEQQRFAKSFRGMQLESSVFGVCVLQLKPQLEKLLGLPPDALTKEIGLTQDLLSMFIEYQVPSDLLCFDGISDATVTEKVAAVKGYVKSVQEVIDSAKQKQLEEEVQKADMRGEMSYDGGIESDPFFGARARDPPFARRSAQMRSSQQTQAPKLAYSMAPANFAPQSMVACMAPASFAPQSMTTMIPQEIDRFEAQLETAQLASWGDEDDYSGGSPEDAYEHVNEEKSLSKEGQKLANDITSSSTTEILDFTAIPKKLDAAFEKHDNDNALHTTKIKLGDKWIRMRQKNLLTKVAQSALTKNDQKTEKDKAFDLLDALSRSGSLPIACAELHVVLGVTHCFEKSVMGTVIQDNINPIEKVDYSTLLIASTIHNVDMEEAVAGSEESTRVVTRFPARALTESL